jgi:hypothetical protein
MQVYPIFPYTHIHTYTTHNLPSSPPFSPLISFSPSTRHAHTALPTHPTLLSHTYRNPKNETRAPIPHPLLLSSRLYHTRPCYPLSRQYPLANTTPAPAILSLANTTPAPAILLPIRHPSLLSSRQYDTRPCDPLANTTPAPAILSPLNTKTRQGLICLNTKTESEKRVPIHTPMPKKKL